ncbi:chalcone isomerase family protein [Chitinibacter bivalviorum]|uniref:Chalcone isomerase family protein n=1 Tax=Chitinibacter bivalviorum TaxID=2739434 RepID=A0A7H9BI37_9NEIS|nr:chalcone isomerase family protein [Chitinibacter bivalviorum]QLG87868.1 chalcone isomerase family protein [Chitinibacter bivalviorum]
MKQVLIALLMAATLPVAHAVDLAGVNVVEQSEVAGKSLQLNGAGIRKKLMFEVYVAALYTAGKSSDAAAVIKSQQPRRMQLTMLRNVEAQTLVDALVDGLKDNLSAAEFTAQTARIAEMQKILLEAKVANKGDVVTLDCLPGQGTRLILRSKVLGQIAGDDFSSALLSIWLGQKPVQEHLKLKLLGM